MSGKEKYGWIVAAFVTVSLLLIRLNIPQKDYQAVITELDEPIQTAAAQKMPINKATAEDLLRLPGVGKKLADAIVLYRTENGDFRAYDELLLVPGIGKAKLEKIKEYYREKGY